MEFKISLSLSVLNDWLKVSFGNWKVVAIEIPCGVSIPGWSPGLRCWCNIVSVCLWYRFYTTAWCKIVSIFTLVFASVQFLILLFRFYSRSTVKKTLPKFGRMILAGYLSLALKMSFSPWMNYTCICAYVCIRVTFLFLASMFLLRFCLWIDSNYALCSRRDRQNVTIIGEKQKSLQVLARHFATFVFLSLNRVE